jgi:multimeric flavodoxin WrbA
MKIVAILGSPRGTKGNTAALLRLTLDGAKSRGAESEIVCLRGGEILPCKGCHGCHEKGACGQKDEFSAIKEKVLAADALVFATPNYISHVSAQLKAFLDRCCGPLHCQSFRGKYGAAVVTSGDGDEKPIAEYLNRFLAISGAIPVGWVGFAMGNAADGEFPESVKKKAAALGETLVDAWKGNVTAHPFQPEAAAFQNRMRTLMLRRKDEWPYEYEYWKQNYGLQ